MKFVHVTDLHIAPGGEKLLELNPVERLMACIADINLHRDNESLNLSTISYQ